MVDRAAAETAAAALGGVYRFEETQESPVAVAWCGPNPEVAAKRREPAARVKAPAAGEKRNREDDAAAYADADAVEDVTEDIPDAATETNASGPTLSSRQLAVVGLPEGASEQDIARLFG